MPPKKRILEEYSFHLAGYHRSAKHQITPEGFMRAHIFPINAFDVEHDDQIADEIPYLVIPQQLEHDITACINGFARSFTSDMAVEDRIFNDSFFARLYPAVYSKMFFIMLEKHNRDLGSERGFTASIGISREFMEKLTDEDEPRKLVASMRKLLDNPPPTECDPDIAKAFCMGFLDPSAPVREEHPEAQIAGQLTAQIELLRQSLPKESIHVLEVIVDLKPDLRAPLNAALKSRGGDRLVSELIESVRGPVSAFNKASQDARKAARTANKSINAADAAKKQVEELEGSLSIIPQAEERKKEAAEQAVYKAKLAQKTALTSARREQATARDALERMQALGITATKAITAAMERIGPALHEITLAESSSGSDAPNRRAARADDTPPRTRDAAAAAASGPMLHHAPERAVPPLVERILAAAGQVSPALHEEDDKASKAAKAASAADDRRREVASAARYGITPGEVARDGNCFFTAVAQQAGVGMVPQCSRGIRALVVDSLNLDDASAQAASVGLVPDPRARITDSAGYARHMLHEGVWAGEPEVQAAAVALQVDVIVFSVAGDRLAAPRVYSRTRGARPQLDSERTLVLLHTGNHYDPITRVDPANAELKKLLKRPLDIATLSAAVARCSGRQAGGEALPIEVGAAVSSPPRAAASASADLLRSPPHVGANAPDAGAETFSSTLPVTITPHRMPRAAGVPGSAHRLTSGSSGGRGHGVKRSSRERDESAVRQPRSTRAARSLLPIATAVDEAASAGPDPAKKRSRHKLLSRSEIQDALVTHGSVLASRASATSTRPTPGAASTRRTPISTARRPVGKRPGPRIDRDDFDAVLKAGESIGAIQKADSDHEGSSASEATTSSVQRRSQLHVRRRGGPS